MLMKPSEEQVMLDSITADLLSKHERTADGDLAPSVWGKFAELGLLALPFSEEDGDMGGSAANFASLACNLGKVPGELPFLGSLVMGSALVRDLATDDTRAALIEALSTGECIIAPAFESRGGERYALDDVNGRVDATGDSLVLSGQWINVLGGASATHFIVAAREGEAAGVSLFLVPAEAAGVTVSPYPVHDGRQDADLAIDGLLLPASARLGQAGEGAVALSEVRDLAMIVACCEAIGAMEELLAQTVEYLQVRKQFGTALAKFQTLRHQAVDMFIAKETAKSMTQFAIACFDDAHDDRALATRAAKLQVSDAARRVAESAVQLHGGIGVTMETTVGRLFQKLTTFQLRFSDRTTCTDALLNAEKSILDI